MQKQLQILVSVLNVCICEQKGPPPMLEFLAKGVESVTPTPQSTTAGVAVSSRDGDTATPSSAPSSNDSEQQPMERGQAAPIQEAAHTTGDSVGVPGGPVAAGAALDEVSMDASGAAEASSDAAAGGEGGDMGVDGEEVTARGGDCEVDAQTVSESCGAKCCGGEGMVANEKALESTEINEAVVPTAAVEVAMGAAAVAAEADAVNEEGGGEEEAKAEAEAEAGVGAEAETEADVEAEAEAEAGTEAKVEAAVEAGTEVEAEAAGSAPAALKAEAGMAADKANHGAESPAIKQAAGDVELPSLQEHEQGASWVRSMMWAGMILLPIIAIVLKEVFNTTWCSLPPVAPPCTPHFSL